MNIITEKYKKFVAGLMKPEEKLAEEIDLCEQELMNNVLELNRSCDIVSSYIQENIIEQHGLIIGRAKCLDFDHMRLGIVGECGELVDPIKRITIYRKKITDLSKEGDTFYKNIREELGDILFYAVGIVTICDKILEQTNIKLYHDEHVDFANLIKEIEIFVKKLELFITHHVNAYISKHAPWLEVITLEEIANENINKLEKRYEQKKYSDTQANERKDKNG